RSLTCAQRRFRRESSAIVSTRRMAMCSRDFATTRRRQSESFRWSSWNGSPRFSPARTRTANGKKTAFPVRRSALAFLKRLSVSVNCLDEIRQEHRCVGRPKAGDRIPAGGRRVSRDSGGREPVVSRCHVVEVGRVPGGGTADLVQGRVDETKRATVDLVCDGDQRGPLRR